MNPYRLRAYLYLLLASVIWGLAGPIIKFTLQGVSPLSFLTYRFALSSIAAIPFLVLAGRQLLKKEVLTESLLYGFLASTMSLGLLFFGLEKTTVLDMTFITLVGPMMIAFSGIIFLKEHITKREKIGMTIALVGTIITISQPLFEAGIKSNQIIGNVLVFLYLIANTTSVILIKRLVRKNIDAAVLTSESFLIGFLTILPLTLFFDKGFSINSLLGLPFPYHLGVIYMALISGNLAYTFWVKGQKTIEVSEAGLFAYLYPIFSAPLAIIWLKEKTTLVFIIGALTIVTGVLIAEFKKRRA